MIQLGYLFSILMGCFVIRWLSWNNHKSSIKGENVKLNHFDNKLGKNSSIEENLILIIGKLHQDQDNQKI